MTIHVDEAEPIGDIQPLFPPRDVVVKKGVNAKELYDLVTEIGRGKFGTVYKCREKSTGLQFAAKFIPIPKRDDRRNVEREVEIMNSLQHSLIIQLYDAFEYQKMMCVVLELIEGGELFDRVIDEDFILTEKACVVLMRQVCQAMEFVHNNQIIHLDLKPENILCLTREGNRIKIIDFGLARRYDPEKKLQVLFGTPEFVAPEVVNFDRISFATDMWSVGVICYVLLSGLSPFMGSTDITTMANVTIGKYDFDDEAFSTVSKSALDFISKLLVKDIEVRMTAKECLQHSWLQRRINPEIRSSPANDMIKIESNMELDDKIIEKNEEELSATKDNLKNFIERWGEHPNSPYVFDANTALIMPTSDSDKHNSTSGFSSRGCSPSPCPSFSNDAEIFSIDIDGESNPANNNDITENNRISDDIESVSSFGKHTPNSCASKDSQYKEYLQSFDRRYSDSNCVIPRTSSCEKVNLADEIKKLSDRLMVLSTINAELTDYNENITNDRNSDRNIGHSSSEGSDTEDFPILDSLEESIADNIDPIADARSKTALEIDVVKKSIIEDSTAKKLSFHSTTLNHIIHRREANIHDLSSNTIRKKCTSHSELFDNDVRNKSKLDGFKPANNVRNSKYIDTFSKSHSIEDNSKMQSYRSNIFVRSKSVLSNTNLSSSKNRASSVVNDLTQRLRVLDDTPSLFKKMVDTRRSSTSTDRSNEYAHESYATAKTKGTSVPWALTNRRTKFRVNKMSRDVPIGSPDSHQMVYLPNAAYTTKDCLLRLLEKYNGRGTSNLGSIGRHQSISVGFGLSDNLEYRSMNSINAFFQRHAQGGTYVRQIQARIESKQK